jgi:hypothetical protein
VAFYFLLSLFLRQEDKTLVDFSQVLTVKQLAGEAPFLTEAKLRWYIFHAEEYGLSKALIRIGGRVYIDRVAFNSWLEGFRDIPRKVA